MENNTNYNNLYLIDLLNEVWVDVLEYNDIYQISNYGRIKSLGRYVSRGNGEMYVREKILKQHLDKKSGEPTVKLAIDGNKKTYRVMTLVANAFMRERLNGEQVCRLDKVKVNNHVDNLIITSISKSHKLNYKLGNQKNWGIESIPKNNRIEYEKRNCIKENSKIIYIECSDCGKLLSVDNFYVKSSNNIIYRNCKKCVITLNAEYRKNKKIQP